MDNTYENVMSLAKASGYVDENDLLSTEGIISAEDLVERIYNIIKRKQAYVKVLEGMDEREKITVFMQIVTGLEWIIAESMVFKDQVTDAFDEVLDWREEQVEKDEDKEEE